MADVRKAIQQVVRAGLAATYHADLTTTDTFLVRNNGHVILHFKKTGAGACTVTILNPLAGGLVDGLVVTNRTISVPATTGDRFVGPFPPHVYNDANGDVRFTLSEVTGLTGAILGVD